MRRAVRHHQAGADVHDLAQIAHLVGELLVLRGIPGHPDGQHRQRRVQALPAPAAALVGQAKGRSDFQIAVPKYGGGVLALMSG